MHSSNWRRSVHYAMILALITMKYFKIFYFRFVKISSSLFQYKKVYEKVGEATETALTVLVEKMNVYGTEKGSADLYIK